MKHCSCFVFQSQESLLLILGMGENHEGSKHVAHLLCFGMHKPQTHVLLPPHSSPVMTVRRLEAHTPFSANHGLLLHQNYRNIWLALPGLLNQACFKAWLTILACFNIL